MPTSFERVRDLLTPASTVPKPLAPTVTQVIERIDRTNAQVLEALTMAPDGAMTDALGLVADALALVDPRDATASEALDLIDRRLFQIDDRRARPPRPIGLTPNR